MSKNKLPKSSPSSFFTILSLAVAFFSLIVIIGGFNKPRQARQSEAKSPVITCADNMKAHLWCPTNLRVKQILEEQTKSSCSYVCADSAYTEKRMETINKTLECPLPDGPYECPENCTEETIYKDCAICRCK